MYGEFQFGRGGRMSFSGVKGPVDNDFVSILTPF